MTKMTGVPLMIMEKPLHVKRGKLLSLQNQIVLLLMDSSVRNQMDAEVQKGMS